MIAAVRVRLGLKRGEGENVRSIENSGLGTLGCQRICRAGEFDSKKHFLKTEFLYKIHSCLT